MKGERGRKTGEGENGKKERTKKEKKKKGVSGGGLGKAPTVGGSGVGGEVLVEESGGL